MDKPTVGSEILIHSYKHDGSIHRSWAKGFVLDANEKHTIVINNNTLVTESDGRMIRKNGVYFYCNIASPSYYDGEALKYIDYDLDLKVFPDYRYKVLDEEEYRQHSLKMHYSKELDAILRKQLSILIDMSMTLKGPFQPNFAKYWYDAYQAEKNRK